MTISDGYKITSGTSVDMGPARFDADVDAFLMETIAMLNNWPHYYN